MDDNEVPLTGIAEFAVRLEGEAKSASTEDKRFMGGPGCKPNKRQSRPRFIPKRKQRRTRIITIFPLSVPPL